jgi:hypothetical protein
MSSGGDENVVVPIRRSVPLKLSIKRELGIRCCKHVFQSHPLTMEVKHHIHLRFTKIKVNPQEKLRPPVTSTSNLTPLRHRISATETNCIVATVPRNVLLGNSESPIPFSCPSQSPQKKITPQKVGVKKTVRRQLTISSSSSSDTGSDGLPTFPVSMSPHVEDCDLF